MPPQNTLADLDRRAQRYLEHAEAHNTRRAVRSDWACFASFCQTYELDPLPASPETVVRYLTWLADSRKPSTLRRRTASIARVHADHGLPTPTTDPTVRRALRGIGRELGLAVARKPPLFIEDLEEIVKASPDTLSGLRDDLVCLLGFWTALRRAELVGIDVEHVTIADNGATIWVPRSKTDSLGRGRTLEIPRMGGSLCPVAVVERWLEATAMACGPLLRPVTRWQRVGTARLQAKTVATIVRAAATRAGIEKAPQLAGHSLRSGFASSAIAAGVPEHLVSRQTNHRSPAVFADYVRLDANAGAAAARQLMRITNEASEATERDRTPPPAERVA